MQKYIVLDKKVGETPLVTAENWRQQAEPSYQNIPLTYAGRLDPMASGKLLVLLGEECKKQDQYRDLDKRYQFSVLLGVASDTGDVLGKLSQSQILPSPDIASLQNASSGFVGEITLPYPNFSSKTVKGKPLHVWTLEKRLDEIEIPKRTSHIFKLNFEKVEQMERQQVFHEALKKVNSIPTVTETSKALGNDFRRKEVREDWQDFLNTGKVDDMFYIAHFSCLCSSGTYMRTLAEELAKKLNTKGLAFHIHRTHIGKYKKLPFGLGWWIRSY